MTIHNNAAPLGRDPIHEAIDILTVAAEELHNAHTINPDDWTGEPEAKAEYDRTLRVVAALSKLRAEGVEAGATDAQEAFATWWTAQDEGSIQFDLEQYPQDLKATLNNLWNTAWRAALASASVTGEAQPVAWRALWTLPTPGVTPWHDTRKVAPPDEAEMRAKGYSLELAFAAPQASEAVRNAALEEAAKQCEDIYTWRGASSAGVLHQTTLDACASAIRALKTQADKDGCVNG